MWQYVDGSEARTTQSCSKGKETLSEDWKCFKQIFESHGAVRKVAQQFLRMERDTNIDEQLEEASIKLPDDLLSIMQLVHESFSVVMESHDDVPLFENLKVKLKEEEVRQSERKIYRKSE
ncbi:hypothetical protein ANTRET_LOCUS5153 [Anthophora retusa]